MSKPSRRTNRQNRPDKSLQGYHNKQPARALALLIAIPLLVCLLTAISRKEHAFSLWMISSLFLLVFMLFSSLTITVSNERLQWHFGPGLIRKQIPMHEIAGAEIIRTRLWDGLGIHYTKRGWLYNVSGRDAVAVTLKDGKGVVLGSNDPVGLWEAIQNRIS